MVTVFGIVQISWKDLRFLKILDFLSLITRVEWCNNPNLSYYIHLENRVMDCVFTTHLPRFVTLLLIIKERQEIDNRFTIPKVY